MNKIILLVGCLFLIGVSFLYGYYSHDEVTIENHPIQDIPIVEKIISYAPIECFVNETHIIDKCHEDYING